MLPLIVLPLNLSLFCKDIVGSAGDRDSRTENQGKDKVLPSKDHYLTLPALQSFQWRNGGDLW